MSRAPKVAITSSWRKFSRESTSVWVDLLDDLGVDLAVGVPEGEFSPKDRSDFRDSERTDAPLLFLTFSFGVLDCSSKTQDNLTLRGCP